MRFAPEQISIIRKAAAGVFGTPAYETNGRRYVIYPEFFDFVFGGQSHRSPLFHSGCSHSYSTHSIKSVFKAMNKAAKVRIGAIINETQRRVPLAWMKMPGELDEMKPYYRDKVLMKKIAILMKQNNTYQTPKK